MRLICRSLTYLLGKGLLLVYNHSLYMILIDEITIRRKIDVLRMLLCQKKFFQQLQNVVHCFNSFKTVTSCCIYHVLEETFSFFDVLLICHINVPCVTVIAVYFIYNIVDVFFISLKRSSLSLVLDFYQFSQVLSKNKINFCFK